MNNNSLVLATESQAGFYVMLSTLLMADTDLNDGQLWLWVEV